MALDPNINTLEKAKFRESLDGAMVAVTLMNDFVTNDTEGETAGTDYVGRSNGVTWEVQKIVDHGTHLTIRYASVKNNPTYLTYNDAWTNRLLLVYETR